MGSLAEFLRAGRLAFADDEQALHQAREVRLRARNASEVVVQLAVEAYSSL